jgi:hypothetical protein
MLATSGSHEKEPRMHRTRTVSNLARAVALAAALAGAAEVGAQSEETIHACVGPAAQMAHDAMDAWRAGLLAKRSASDARERDMLVQLFAFAGAARTTADLISRHDTARDEMRESLEALEFLSASVRRAVDAARPLPDVVRAWDRVARDLDKVQELFWGPSASTSPTGAPPPTPQPTPPPPPPPPTQPAADRPVVEILEARSGGSFFTPDLVVKGRFRGKQLDRAEILLLDADGEVVYRDSKVLTEAIASQAASVPRDQVATVEWGVRVPHESQPQGEATIRVIAWDKRANEGRAETKSRVRNF